MSDFNLRETLLQDHKQGVIQLIKQPVNVPEKAVPTMANKEKDLPLVMPENVTNPNGNWPVPDEAMFYGIAGDIVRTIEPHTEADPVAILVQNLCAFGNVIGRNAHYRVEADKHHMNLFVVMPGETSKGRKGTSWGRVEGLYKSVDPEWASQNVKSGLSSGEGVICRAIA